MTILSTCITILFTNSLLLNNLSCSQYCNHKRLEDYTNKIKSDLKTAVMGSWAVWVPAHTINFAFIPPSQRLLYINSIQIGYNVFLSFLGNKKVDGGEEDKKEL